MQTTDHVVSSRDANSSPGKAILLSPRISLAKHVCLLKRALCICLHAVQKKTLSSLTHVRCSTFLVFCTKKKSRWYYLLTRSHISLLPSRREGDDRGERHVTIEGKKRGMSRKRELLLLLFFMKLYHTHCFTPLSLAMFVLIESGCLFERITDVATH
jgi:hypothetical protein